MSMEKLTPSQITKALAALDPEELADLINNHINTAEVGETLVDHPIFRALTSVVIRSLDAHGETENREQKAAMAGAKIGFLIGLHTPVTVEEEES